MSELPTVANVSTEVIPLRNNEQDSSLRFAGLTYEKALAVAEKYLAPTDVILYLRPYLGENRTVLLIAHDTGYDQVAVERHIQKLEVQLAEAHLANIPRGYGHTAALLTIVRDKDTA